MQTVTWNHSQGSLSVHQYGGSKAKQRLDMTRVALCVPSTCEPSDIEDAVREYLRQNNRSMAGVAVEEGGCFRRDDPTYNFTAGDIAYW